MTDRRATAPQPRATAAPPPIDRLLRLPEVLEIVGLGKSMVYRKARAGTFPKPCNIGGRSARWSEAEVRAWVTASLAARAA